MKLKLKPVGDRVLVEALQPEKLKSSRIIIPDSVEKEKSQVCVVLVLGDGKRDSSASGTGKFLPFRVEIFDEVLVNKYAGTDIQLDGKDYRLISSDDILGIFNEK